MSTQTFGAITRHAAARLSRRGSLLTLGGAALAATIASPGLSDAKKKRQRKGPDCKKKEKQRCSNDAAACKDTVAPFCSPDNPAQCLAVQACCEECSASGILACITALLES